MKCSLIQHYQMSLCNFISRLWFFKTNYRWCVLGIDSSHLKQSGDVGPSLHTARREAGVDGEFLIVRCTWDGIMQTYLPPETNEYEQRKRILTGRRQIGLYQTMEFNYRHRLIYGSPATYQCWVTFNSKLVDASITIPWKLLSCQWGLIVTVKKKFMRMTQWHADIV